MQGCIAVVIDSLVHVRTMCKHLKQPAQAWRVTRAPWRVPQLARTLDSRPSLSCTHASASMALKRTHKRTHAHVSQQLEQTCLGRGYAHCPFLTPHMFLALLHHDRLLTHGAFEHIPIAMQLVVLHVSQGHRGVAVETHTHTGVRYCVPPTRYIPHIRVAHTSSCTCPPLSGHRCRQSKPWTGDSHPPHAS